MIHTPFQLVYTVSYHSLRVNKQPQTYFPNNKPRGWGFLRMIQLWVGKEGNMWGQTLSEQTEANSSRQEDRYKAPDKEKKMIQGSGILKNTACLPWDSDAGNYRFQVKQQKMDPGHSGCIKRKGLQCRIWCFPKSWGIYVYLSIGFKLRFCHMFYPDRSSFVLFWCLGWRDSCFSCFLKMSYLIVVKTSVISPFCF